MKAYNLKNIRAARKLRQSDLARLLEVTERTVRRWESGDTVIPHSVKLAIKSLGLSKK